MDIRMKIILDILYILVAVSVILLILFQGRGAGLGSAWGGSGESFSTRRGVERITFMICIFCVALFLVLSVVKLLV